MKEANKVHNVDNNLKRFKISKVFAKIKKEMLPRISLAFSILIGRPAYVGVVTRKGIRSSVLLSSYDKRVPLGLAVAATEAQQTLADYVVDTMKVDYEDAVEMAVSGYGNVRTVTNIYERKGVI